MTERSSTRKKIPDYLTKAEVESILVTIDKAAGKYAFRNRLIVEIMFWCGLRVSEVVSLQINNIEWEKRSLTLLNTKGGKSRVIPIKEELLTHLRLYVQNQRTKAKFYRNDPLFISANGKSLTTRRIEQIIKRYVDILEMPKRITPHTFRHSFAVHFTKAGLDTKTLQQLLGHEWVSTTEIYLDHILSFEELQKAYDEVS